MTSIVLVLYGALAIFAANYLYTLRKKFQDHAEQLDAMKKQIEHIAQDHPMLVNADLIFSRQLKDINAQLVSMDNQLQGLENKRDNDGGYQHALRILEMGGDKKEIVESCHLSNAEADLLMNLNAYRKAIKTS